MKTTKLFLTLFTGAALLLIGCSKDNSTPTYTITVNNDGGGQAYADKTKAEEGETVTLTATADDGYLFSQWTVLSGGVSLADPNSAVTTFTMPAGAVEIKAVFEEKQPVDVDVYVSSTVQLPGAANEQAIVWKNGQLLYELTDGSQVGVAGGIAISGSDVYVTGNEYNGTKDVARIWKNGEELYQMPENAYATSVTYGNAIAVSGSDIYTSGYATGYAKRFFARVWKNDAVFYELCGDVTGNQTPGGMARAITLAGSDNYAAGRMTKDFYNRATVWKNGAVLHILGAADHNSYGYAILLSGSDVYTGGAEEAGFINIAKIWKNGSELYSLTDSSADAIATSLAVSGSDLYAAGFDGTKVKVWKNGQLLYTLTENGVQDCIYSIAIFGDNVYVAGVDGEPAKVKVWKNDQPLYTLDGMGSFFSDTYIAVTPAQ